MSVHFERQRDVFFETERICLTLRDWGRKTNKFWLKTYSDLSVIAKSHHEVWAMRYCTQLAVQHSKCNGWIWKSQRETEKMM